MDKLYTSGVTMKGANKGKPFRRYEPLLGAYES